ncbi:hypothetical protein ACRW16_12955, partial [Escherichia coli]
MQILLGFGVPRRDVKSAGIIVIHATFCQRLLLFVNATMFDRYLPFSCPLNTFVTDAVRFPPFHH